MGGNDFFTFALNAGNCRELSLSKPVYYEFITNPCSFSGSYALNKKGSL
jgi:hypothetical protein